MAECHCTVFHETSNLNQTLKNAIEVGDKQFFIRQAVNGKQQVIIKEKIYKYSILEYIAIRAQKEIFFYLLSDDNWCQHIKILLNSDHLIRLPFLAVQGGDIEISKYILRLLQAEHVDVATLTYGKSNDNILRHLINHKHENSLNDIELLNLLFSEKIADECMKWVDSQHNTLLHVAAQKNNLLGLRYFIETKHYSPLVKNNRNETPFDLLKDPLAKQYADIWKKRYYRNLAFVSCCQQRYKNIEGNNVIKLPKELIKYICDFFPSLEEDLQTSLSNDNKPQQHQKCIIS